MTLDKKITLYKNLTPVEVRIGNYIMNHKEVILNSTIQDLEKEVFVSKPAIHRFCKKIGLNVASYYQGLLRPLLRPLCSSPFPGDPYDRSPVL